MKKIYLLTTLFAAAAFAGCEVYESPERGDNSGSGDVRYYVNQYDPIRDEGQYWHPEWAPATKE